MRHYEETRWADFARELVAPDERESMRRHLETGCQRCARTLAVQRTLTALADADRRFEAPDYAVRQIKGFFALNRPESRSRLAPMVMNRLSDTGLEPVRQGVRGGVPSERQILFESEDYGLDLRIAPFDGADGVLTGTLARRSGAPVGRVPAYLLVDDRVVDQGVSDDDGQFELAADLGRGAVLWLAVGKDRQVAVAVEPIN